MPEPRLPMRKVRDVLRLSAAGLSKRKIAASLGMSATAALDCIWRARRAGLAWPLPADLTDEELVCGESTQRQSEARCSRRATARTLSAECFSSSSIA